MALEQKHQNGYFVLSFDTELAWGYFDKDGARESLFSRNGEREQAAIRRVLALCERYGIRATWALVGHLLHPKCEGCEICPILAWKTKYRSFNSIFETAHPLWYAPKVIDLLISHCDRHEIAFHGYTHRTFTQMDTEQSKHEIMVWNKLIERHGIKCTSIIFPRNAVAKLEQFRMAGFNAFRGPEPEYSPLPGTRVGALLKALDYLLSISSPYIYDIDELYVMNGLLDVRGSAHLFDFNRRLELILDSLGLHFRRIHRVARAINQAAKHKKLFHLWAHPWEFRTEKDFSKLEYILKIVARHVAQGRLESLTMSEITSLSLNFRH